MTADVPALSTSADVEAVLSDLIAWLDLQSRACEGINFSASRAYHAAAERVRKAAAALSTPPTEGSERLAAALCATYVCGGFCDQHATESPYQESDPQGDYYDPTPPSATGAREGSAVQALAGAQALREAEFEVRDAQTLPAAARAAVCAVLRGRASRLEAIAQDADRTWSAEVHQRGLEVAAAYRAGLADAAARTSGGGALREDERDQLRARLVNARWDAAQAEVASLDARAQHVVRGEVHAEVNWYVDAVADFLAARATRPAPDVLACYDCGLPYGDPGWCDTHIPDAAWLRISPTGHEGGVLCLTCIARRLVAAGVEGVPLKVTSGPWEYRPAPDDQREGER